jgi:hypothetical protein
MFSPTDTIETDPLIYCACGAAHQLSPTPCPTHYFAITFCILHVAEAGTSSSQRLVVLRKVAKKISAYKYINTWRAPFHDVNELVLHRLVRVV